MYEHFMSDSAILRREKIAPLLDGMDVPGDADYIKAKTEGPPRDLFLSAMQMRSDALGSIRHGFRGDLSDCTLSITYHFLTFVLRKKALPDVTAEEVKAALKKHTVFTFFMANDTLNAFPTNAYEWETAMKRLCMYGHIIDADEKGKAFLKDCLKTASLGKSEEDLEGAVRFMSKEFEGMERAKEPDMDGWEKHKKVLYTFRQYYNYVCTRLLHDTIVLETPTEFDDFLWGVARWLVMESIHPAYQLNREGVQTRAEKLLPWEQSLRMMSRHLPEYALYHTVDSDSDGDFVWSDDYVCLADACMHIFSEETDQKKALMLVQAAFVGQYLSQRRGYISAQYLFEKKADEKTEEKDRKDLAIQRLAFSKEKDAFERKKSSLDKQSDELEALKKENEALKEKLKKKDRQISYMEQTVESLLTFDDKDEAPAANGEVQTGAGESEVPEPTEEELEREIRRLEDMKSYLSGKRIALYGGHDNLVCKLKDLFPGWLYIGAHGKAKKEQLSGKDAVVFLTDHLAHATFYSARDMASAANVPTCYAHGTNIDILTENIYKTVKEAEEYEKGDEKDGKI